MTMNSLSVLSAGPVDAARFAWRFAVMIAALCALLIAPAHALELASAKAQGLVGEQADGYLGIPQPPGSAEVQAFVAEINLARREKYKEIAATNGTSLEAVEQLSGKTLIERAKPGEWVRGSDGKWVQKS